MTSKPTSKFLTYPFFRSLCLALALLAQPAFAASDAVSDAGTDNTITLFNQGDDNQIALEQVGELNSLSLLIQAHNVSSGIFQHGNANLVAGLNGDPSFMVAGADILIEIVQNGMGNQVYGIQLSANSIISITQLGNGNITSIAQR